MEGFFLLKILESNNNDPKWIPSKTNQTGKEEVVSGDGASWTGSHSQASLVQRESCSCWFHVQEEEEEAVMSLNLPSLNQPHLLH